MQTRVLARSGEQSDAGAYYTPEQARIVLNEGQRLFAFFTLCLEGTGTIPLTANQPWYRPLTYLPDWIAPLRLRNSGVGGAKLEPDRLERLDALSSNWQLQSGPSRRYACAGANLLVFNPVPSTGGATLSVTYARSPLPLVGAGQAPEIPEEYHPDLIDWAIARLRTHEGAQEIGREQGRLRRFWRGVQKLAMYVRTRNLAARYDRLPPEERFFDGSRLADITSRRKHWPTTLDIPQGRDQRSQPTT